MFSLGFFWARFGKHTDNDGKSPFFHGKINYFYGHFNSYVTLPEGILDCMSIVLLFRASSSSFAFLLVKSRECTVFYAWQSPRIHVKMIYVIYLYINVTHKDNTMSEYVPGRMSENFVSGYMPDMRPDNMLIILIECQLTGVSQRTYIIVFN